MKTKILVKTVSSRLLYPIINEFCKDSGLGFEEAKNSLKEGGSLILDDGDKAHELVAKYTKFGCQVSTEEGEFPISQTMPEFKNKEEDESLSENLTEGEKLERLKEAGNLYNSAQIPNLDISKRIGILNQVIKDYPESPRARDSKRDIIELHQIELHQLESKRLFEKALELRLKGKSFDSVELYKKIIKQYPHTSEANKSKNEIENIQKINQVLNIIKDYETKGDNTKIIKLYRQIIEISPDSPEAQHAKSQLEEIQIKPIGGKASMLESQGKITEGLIKCDFCGDTIKPYVTYCKHCGIKIRG